MATILVVDDRPGNRQFLMTLLGYAGHTLVEAADGGEALAQARIHRPDLVITDILMPNMDGYEFTQQLRKEQSLNGTPVIFYSATYHVREAGVLAEACGAIAVLPKPSEPQVILDTVSRALGVDPPRAVAAEPADDGAQGMELRGINDRVSEYLKEMQGAQLTFDRLVEQSAELAAERQRLRGLSAKYTRNLVNMQRITSRLYALIEVGLNLAGERDPAKLLEKLFAAATRILPSQYAAACILDSEGRRPRLLHASGIDPAVFTRAPPGAARQDLLHCLLDERRRLRVGDPHRDIPAPELPADHPPVRHFLGVPMATATALYGWMYFANGADGPAFTDEDEHIAETLAASGTLFFENASFYELIQHHASQLQLEVTQRKRLNRMHAVLSGINTLIVRVRSRPELFQEACRVAVELGQFPLAWIALVDGDKAAPVAFFGEDQGLLQGLRFSMRPDGPASAAPVERALRTGKPCVSNDLINDVSAAHWREAVRALGLGAFMAHPLIVGGQVVGCLGLYATEPNFFDEQEMALLSDLAADISYAMEFITRDEQIDYLALYDPLTRLPNRALFITRLERFIEIARENGKSFAVLMLDVTRFKSFNELLGRAGGDEVLKRIGDRIKHIAGGPSFMGRIGNDAFAAVLPDIQDARGLAACLQDKWWDQLNQPVQMEDQDLEVSFRIGIARFPDDGSDAERLLRNAEAALKLAKNRGDRVVHYARDMSAAVVERLRLERQMRHALERQEFALRYQPKVDLRTGAIHGVEALIRWNSAEQGLVLPSHFMRLLEETGMILDAGRWVLRQALADQRRWMERGLPPVRVAVNVSQVQLRQPDFVEEVKAAVGAAGNGRPGLDLEVTESMLMTEVEANIEKLKTLRDLGITIAIDDFGTGYSSLAYLARLPIGAVKIDRSFIATMTESADTMSIVSTIISLARSMNLKVIAEGVETEEQLKFLRLLKCDEMQGFLFDPPLSADELPRRLRTLLP